MRKVERDIKELGGTTTVDRRKNEAVGDDGIYSHSAFCAWICIT